MEPGSDNTWTWPLSQNICSETQFKIQHLNHEMKSSVITHIFETARGYHEAGPCT